MGAGMALLPEESMMKGTAASVEARRVWTKDVFVGPISRISAVSDAFRVLARRPKSEFDPESASISQVMNGMELHVAGT